MINSEYDYYIAEDSFIIYFPDDDYTILDLWDWYSILPTKPQPINYYGDNIQLIKEHFQHFVDCNNIKTRKTNDLHAESYLTVNVFVIYDRQNEVQGFAAQEWLEGFAAEKKILYLNKEFGE